MKTAVTVSSKMTRTGALFFVLLFTTYLTHDFKNNRKMDDAHGKELATTPARK